VNKYKHAHENAAVLCVYCFVYFILLRVAITSIFYRNNLTNTWQIYLDLAPAMPQKFTPVIDLNLIYCFFSFHGLGSLCLPDSLLASEPTNLFDVS
jgi:hypothetical protein